MGCGLAKCLCLPLCALPPVPQRSASLYTHGVLLHTRKYIGFVDVSDLALLITSKGLERPVPEGFLAKVGNLFSTDWEHTVGKAVNVSEHDPFYGLPLTGNLAQVRVSFPASPNPSAFCSPSICVYSAYDPMRCPCDSCDVCNSFSRTLKLAAFQES